MEYCLCDVGLSGMGKGGLVGVGVGTDFFAFSPDFRMMLGALVIPPSAQELPLTLIETIGIEYHIPFWSNHFFLGYNYYKSYLSERKNNLAGNKS